MVGEYLSYSSPIAKYLKNNENRKPPPFLTRSEIIECWCWVSSWFQIWFHVKGRKADKIVINYSENNSLENLWYDRGEERLQRNATKAQQASNTLSAHTFAYR